MTRWPRSPSKGRCRTDPDRSGGRAGGNETVNEGRGAPRSGAPQRHGRYACAPATPHLRTPIPERHPPPSAARPAPNARARTPAPGRRTPSAAAGRWAALRGRRPRIVPADCARELGPQTALAGPLPGSGRADRRPDGRAKPAPGRGGVSRGRGVILRACRLRFPVLRPARASGPGSRRPTARAAACAPGRAAAGPVFLPC